MTDPFSPKQIEFILNSNKSWNIAHGAVSTGKTVCTLYRFMEEVNNCPDNQIFLVGHSCDTAYQNAVKLILETDEFSLFRPFCSWFSGKRILKFRDKEIKILGAKDEGALGIFRGLTASLMYCDEMTLYPDSIIDMIDTRLRKGHSKGFASMNPTYPDHKCKQWIDKAMNGNPNYYSLHFQLDDNPFISEEYKDRIRNSSTGMFYKRNVLGLWCMAEGAIFDFFDRKINVVSKPPAAAEYWVAGIDYGISNAFACVLIGVSTGKYTQTGKKLWVEKEYYWDFKKTGRQKTNSEFADDVQSFLEPYGVKQIYIDPSALAFKLDLQRRGMHVVEANNDVYNGIQMMTSEMAKGNLMVCQECPNLIREIENYVWDSKKSKEGDDAPVKKGDHAVDALRYVMATHKIAVYDPYKNAEYQKDYLRDRYSVTRKF
jgi:PBSX family phage terminase large subunit